MKWAFSVRNRFVTALLLALTFILIVSKNIMDRKNVSELGSSFSSVYEDRLLVESYIYKLSDHLYQKRMMIDDCSNIEDLPLVRKEVSNHNQAITHILADYERTKLTPSESSYFSDLKKNVTQMMELEDVYMASYEEGAINLQELKSVMNLKFNHASHYLHQLSSIQVSEGKSLSDYSKKIIAGSTILTQLEQALLIGIGLLIQVLILSSKTSVSRIQQSKPSLN